MRCAGKGSTDYSLTANNPPPNRDAILKNKHNKPGTLTGAVFIQPRS